MSTRKYNFQKEIDAKKTARASMSNIPISTKYAVEFSNYFNGMLLRKAIKITEDIEQKKDYLPLVKYNLKVAHRKGDSKRNVASGRYPVKATKYVKNLLLDVKSNAENLNLDFEKLKIIHMFANKGVTRSKLQPLGRVAGKQRESKSTNIEVIVLEE